MKIESLSRKKLGKREYLNDTEIKGLMRALSQYFKRTVAIPRIRIGKRQAIESMINEEAMLFATFLRKDKENLSPRANAIEIGGLEAFRNGD